MRNLTFTFAALALVGCAVEEDIVATDETEQGVVSANGIGLNGIGLNGIGLNGTSLDAAAIVGSTWSGQLSDGSALELRVDSMTQGTGVTADVGMYAFSYNTAEGWRPLCGVDGSGVPIRALAVPGTWNLTTGAYATSSALFTLACRGKSIAKCVEMGYKQWTRPEHMQACTRLLRGDYCGNGLANTIDGQTVDVYDNVGLQSMTYTTWDPEAEWGVNGAKCVSQIGRQRFSALGLPTPTCISSGVVPTTATCAGTTNLWQGVTRLMNRLPPLKASATGGAKTMSSASAR